MSYIEEMAQRHGLDHTYEGTIPVRICGIYTDEILGVYKYFHRGRSQQAIRDLMVSLQETLDSMIAAGVD
jgi:hypothetical protein